MKLFEAHNHLISNQFSVTGSGDVMIPNSVSYVYWFTEAVHESIQVLIVVEEDGNAGYPCTCDFDRDYLAHGDNFEEFKTDLATLIAELCEYESESA